jgi:hypothetical protein
VTEAFFKASITYVVGNGENTFFRADPWIDGESLTSLMPQLVEAVPSRLWRQCTVASALANSAWIQDIRGALSIPVLVQYLQLRQRLLDRALSSVADRIMWRRSSSGPYSVSTAYQAMFTG